VPAEHYEEAMARSKKLKEYGLAEAESEEERAQTIWTKRNIVHVMNVHRVPE
jgi:hypothetical protein